MKLIRTIYTDLNGNVWEVQQEKLPKKKGVYTYWVAECKELNKCLRADLKRKIIALINKKP